MFGFNLRLQSYESTDSDMYIVVGTNCVFILYFLMCHCRHSNPLEVPHISLVRPLHAHHFQSFVQPLHLSIQQLHTYSNVQYLADRDVSITVMFSTLLTEMSALQ